MNEDIKLGDLVKNTKAQGDRKQLVGVVVEEMNGEYGKNSYLKVKWLPNGDIGPTEVGAGNIWYKRPFLVKVEQ
tara:strand:+ start:324 stop:545 length:222 start_codon:yes stop_codon:yes gene_type:complete